MKSRRRMLPAAVAAAIMAILVQSPCSPAHADYLPDQLYRGDFGPALLYYRNPDTGKWVRSDFERSYSAAVTCTDARQQLHDTGRWRGRLNRKGACVTDDSAPVREWAVGNWLNSEHAPR